MMATTRVFKVDTFIERLYCQECDVEMKSTGDALASNPPQYVYKCSKCGDSVNSHNVYPKIAYKEFT